MKDKVLIFIIGLLIGAIITTAGFFIYFKIFNNNNQLGEMQMNENGQMDIPQDGQGGDNGEEPPEKPNGDDEEEPPEIQSNDTSEEA